MQDITVGLRQTFDNLVIVCYIYTPGKRQSKMLILSTNIDKNC